jgi:uncharacterized protein (TIGR00288 family)
MKSDPRVMLLVDADNVSPDVVEQAFARVLDAHGAIHVRRAYCTAESALKNLALFKRLSIRPIVNLSTGKNSTDIALAVDAIDLVVAERPDLVVIVSSDSDFAPLVIRLREKGCRVEGIGQHGKTGDDAKPVYDAFVDLTHGKSRATASARAAPEKAPRAKSTAPRRRARAPAAPALPDDVQAILAAVPPLAAGGWVELRTAAEPLRKAGLLGKTAASTKVFKKQSAHFALQPEKAPNQVRYLGAAARG